MTNSTGLATVQDPVAFIGKLGQSFGMSGMFGCKTIEQGHVLALHCLMEQVSPLSIMQTYHFIEGKLSMRADAMLGRANAAGYRHKVITRTPDCATIFLADSEGDGHEFTLTWADAQKEPFVRKKDGGIKDNWNTPRIRMQMLWARVVSDAVRTMCPQIVCGAYTPEELDDESPLPASVIEGELAQEAPTPVPAVPAPAATEKPTRTRKPKAETTESAPAAAPENVQATASGPQESVPAVPAPALPQPVIDIIDLRDYVGPRWPSNKGPWEATWEKVKTALQVPAGESDEERFTKAAQPLRDRVIKWLNDQRVAVDRVGTSKDLAAFANQSPQKAAAAS